MNITQLPICSMGTQSGQSSEIAGPYTEQKLMDLIKKSEDLKARILSIGSPSSPDYGHLWKEFVASSKDIKTILDSGQVAFRYFSERLNVGTEGFGKPLKAGQFEISKETFGRTMQIENFLKYEEIRATECRAMDEFVQAFRDNNKGAILECIPRLKTTLNIFRPGGDRLNLGNIAYSRQSIIMRLDRLAGVIKGEYHKLSNLYPFLQDLSKEGAMNFCKELQVTFPNYLSSLPTIKEKIAALTAARPPDKIFGYHTSVLTPDIETIIKEMIVKEGEKLIPELVSELKNNSDSIHQGSLAITFSLAFEGYCLHAEDFLAKHSVDFPQFLQSLERQGFTINCEQGLLDGTTCPEHYQYDCDVYEY